MSRIPKRKIVIRKGDTYTHAVTEFDDNGVASDLTGSTFLVQLKLDPADTTPVVTFTSTLLNAVQGQWQFSLTPVQTTALNEGVYFYDVQRTYSDGAVHTRFEGEAEVELDVSRA
jgi:hypothetical protein